MKLFKFYLIKLCTSMGGQSSQESGLSEIDRFRTLGVTIGKNVSLIAPISPVAFSSEPYLVSIGDNSTISFDVVFVTHDAATR